MCRVTRACFSSATLQLTMANQEKEDKTTKMDVDPKNEKSVDDKKKDKKEEEEELVTSPDLPCTIDGFYLLD